MAKTHFGEKIKTLAKKKKKKQTLQNLIFLNISKIIFIFYIFDLYFHNKHFFLEEEVVQVGHMVSCIE